MEKDFIIIAITSPDYVADEEVEICRILESREADILHIRKPEWDYERTRSLIEKIPCRFHDRIKIHDHFELVNEFGLYGVHLNSRNPRPIAGAKSVSCSFHTIEQLHTPNHYDYVTLSPIFDSISKKGYAGKFNLTDLKESIKDKKVVALGGVSPEKIPLLRDAGFFGAAMLGYFWNKTFPE